MGKILFKIFWGLLIFLLTPTLAFASHGNVLGTKTFSSRIDLPVNEGPGLLLPTSPLYFADLWRDNLTLWYSRINGVGEAREHLRIAGERISEVKILLGNKNGNTKGLDIALANIAEHVNGAKEALKQEKNGGKNVEQLAVDLNSIIDNQQKALDILARASDSKAAYKIASLLESISEDEIEIEDEMPQALLASEIEDELEEKIASKMDTAKDASQYALTLALELEQKAKMAAAKDLNELYIKLSQESRAKRKEAENLLSMEQKKKLALQEARSDLRDEVNQMNDQVANVQNAIDHAITIRRVSAGDLNTGTVAGASDEKVATPASTSE